MATLFTSEQISFLFASGWDDREIERLVMLMKHFQLPAEVVEEGRVVFGPWVKYRTTPWADLRRAIRLESDPPELTVVWADGSGTVKDDHAGIGVVVEEGSHGTREYSEYIGYGTNNVAELSAIYRGLQAVPDQRRRILIRSDSEYSIGILTKGWVPKKNLALVDRIRKELKWRGANVTFSHVRGHAGIEGNERADRLAKAGREEGRSGKAQEFRLESAPEWEALGMVGVRCACGRLFPHRKERGRIACRHCNRQTELRYLMALS